MGWGTRGTRALALLACALALLAVGVAGDQDKPAATAASAEAAEEAARERDALLAAKIKVVAQAQRAGTDTTKLPADAVPQSEAVEEEPAAQLWGGGTGDLALQGPCEADLERFCKEVEPGEGRLASCITHQLEEEEEGDDDGHTVSGECRRELRAFRRDRATNINKDLGLAKACRGDIKRLCYRGGALLQACSNPEGLLDHLRQNKRQLSDKCGRELEEEEEDEARDWAIDPGLHRACAEDAEELCGDVDEDEEGAVTQCLLEQLGKVGQMCREQLHRVQGQRAGDVRLDRHLSRACSGDMRRFCKGVEPGEGRAEECLQDHREEARFSGRCRQALEERMERAAADYELNYGLREHCVDDVERLCKDQRQAIAMAEGFGADAQVITCLETQRDRIRGKRCAEEVARHMRHESEDIRFDHALANACHADVKKHCADVTPGSARVIGCLHAAGSQLSPQCSHKLFEHDIRLAEDIDFKYPLKRACATEISLLCADVPHGHARVVRCLQDNLLSDEMSEECRAEVTKDERAAAADFRLNWRLHQACGDDAQALCAAELKACGDASSGAAEPCEGRVMACLRSRIDALANDECRQEVLHEAMGQAENYQRDVGLSKACKGDVARLCKGVKPGKGRVHECLRKQMDQLSPECREDELQLAVLQSRDIRLQPALAAACTEEQAAFCPKVEPGKARVYRCLTEHMGKPGFGDECRQALLDRIAATQADYRLDYGIGQRCRADAERQCGGGGAGVLPCLVRKFKQLQGPCQDELARGVRAALWGFRLGAPLTRACDADVQAVCPAAAAQKGRGSQFALGSVGRCLATAVAEAKALTAPCRELVLVAAPRDARAIVAGSSGSVEAVAARVAEIAKKAGLSAALVNQHGSGLAAITVTGWVAFASVAALVLVVAGLAAFGVWRAVGARRRFRYSPVAELKEGDV